MGMLIVIGLTGGIVLLFNLHTPSLSNSPTVDNINSVVETEMSQTETIMAAATIQPAAETPLPTQPENPTGMLNTTDPDAYYLANTNLGNYMSWITKLSGAEEVMIDGQPFKIETRYSYAMFTGQTNAKALEYLLETIRQWIPEEQITVEPYQYIDGMGANTWYNIIITFPGVAHPDEQVLFTAHFDSCVVFEGNPLISAPGANDNGTGVATILESLPIFAKMKFDRTLKVVLFSGEENFQEGSKAYVAQHRDTDHIIGVVNMDMYGTDKDGDRCFEMYVGSVPCSGELANALIDTIKRYDLNLKYDYLTTTAYDRADHRPFWDAGIPAVTLMENFLADFSPGGCETGMDRTDCWHLPCDTAEKINQPYAFDVGLVGALTVLELAGAHPVEQ